jgi:hypothetical protein
MAGWGLQTRDIWEDYFRILYQEAYKLYVEHVLIYLVQTEGYEMKKKNYNTPK